MSNIKLMRSAMVDVGFKAQRRTEGDGPNDGEQPGISAWKKRSCPPAGS